MISKVSLNGLAHRVLGAFSVFLLTLTLKADVLELANGDRYQGTIISMTGGEIEFQSEIQGRLKLPRAKVARIVLGEAVAARPATNNAALTNAHPASLPGTNNSLKSTAATPVDAVVQQMRQGGADSKLVNQVQEQIIGKSSPEAAQKFDELMGGLMTGRLSVQDIRTEAQNSINQINAAKKDLGDDAGDLLDGYLAILERFVQESAAPATNSAPAQPAAAPAAVTPSAIPAPKK